MRPSYMQQQKKLTLHPCQLNRGYSSHLWGWLLDHITAMDFVDAQGNFKTVTSTSDADLWWALRGAGASNFGIVTAFTYALEDAPTSSE